ARQSIWCLRIHHLAGSAGMRHGPTNWVIGGPLGHTPIDGVKNWTGGARLRSTKPSTEDRYPDDGWGVDSHCGGCSDPALGGLDQPFCLGRLVGDFWLRLDRLG